MAAKKAKKSPTAEQSFSEVPAKVIVKFHDHIQVPFNQAAASQTGKLGIGDWRGLVAKFKGITIAPLFTSKTPGEIRELVNRAKRLDPTYRPPNFLNYFAITIPTNINAHLVAIALSIWPAVQQAYVEPPPTEPPGVDQAGDELNVRQGYLDPATDGGIDARYVWGKAGGDGEGQALVDMEWGWALDHKDLVAHGITMISGFNKGSFSHGAGVLGIIAAIDTEVQQDPNERGYGLGITPKLKSVRVVSQWLSSSASSYRGTAQPILDAIAVMSFGDVLLLEAQTPWANSLVPVEVELATFDVIRLATALGIIAVEAAGNGGANLDLIRNPLGTGPRIFKKGTSDFRDSGAIIVGAASSALRHERLGLSCHGSRVDCYGWGENVATLSTGSSGWTNSFGGTSSASAIVAGAALAVQGLAQKGLGRRLGPWQLRAILRNPANGTPSWNYPASGIGVMPNLKAIFDGNALTLAPDIYLCDFAGDPGLPHTEAVSASPDVILRQSAVADPQSSFGPGSGTEYIAPPSDDAVAGQDNFIYVRVRNKGGSTASSVQVKVSWARHSDLLVPALWQPVGTTTIDVPTSDLPTVSNAIVWQAATVPTTGSYCLIVFLNHSQDPAPAPANFSDLNNFQKFINLNNNVTRRDFNVV